MNTQCFCCKKFDSTIKVYSQKGELFCCKTCVEKLLKSHKIVQAFDGNQNAQWQTYALMEDVISTYDNKYYLTKTYAKHFKYIICPYCNKLHSDKSTPDSLCPTCTILKGYIRCSNCGSWHLVSTMPQNGEFCPICIAKNNKLLLNKYHESHNRECSLIGHTGDKKYFRGLGFELEIDCFKPIDKAKFISDICNIVKEEHGLNLLFIEQDSSLLNGVELISQPHTKEALDEFIQTKMDNILRRLQNTPAEDCSKLAALHVHISRTIFGHTLEEQNTNIAKLIYWVSRNVKFLTQLGRRKDFSKCAFPIEPLSKEESLDFVVDPESRYTAINVCNPNTVEFRFMQTTTYTHILRALIDFCWHLATQISKFDWQDLDGNQFLHGLPTSTQEYCQEIGLVINKEK